MTLRTLFAALFLLLTPGILMAQEATASDHALRAFARARESLGTRVDPVWMAGVKLQVVDDESFKALQRAAFARVFAEERLGGTELLLRAVGLLDPSHRFEELQELAMPSPLAVFDPRDDRLVLASHATELPPFELQFVMIHALRRASLSSEGSSASLDESLARHLLEEGGASLTGTQLALEKEGWSSDVSALRPRALPTSATFLRGLTQRTNAGLATHAARLRDASPLAARLAGDPTIVGSYAAAAWGGNAVATNTRDILFASTTPGERVKPDVIATVELSPLFPEGWQRLHTDVMGAFLLHVLLEDDPERARAVAEGWRGDRVQVWGKDDETVFCAVFLFDAPKAATLFDQALGEKPGPAWSVKRAGRIVAVCRGVEKADELLDALASSRIGKR